ncbi:hypothetical protein PMAYCL1PPCAC_17395, partial [Pristionchus mayeri]
MTIHMVVTSFAIPFSSMSLDSIYSKIFGSMDQSVTQSIIVVADDIMSIVGPIYASTVFSSLGRDSIYYINGSVYIIATVTWFAAWKWLEPFN